MAAEDETWSLDGEIQQEMERLVLKKLKVGFGPFTFLDKKRPKNYHYVPGRGLVVVLWKIFGSY